MSVWSDQPTVDMASEKWHDQLRNFFKFWIGLGIDGFVFDYPDGYIDAGVDSGNLGWDYDPEMIRTALSGVVRDVGNCAVTGSRRRRGRDVDRPRDAAALVSLVAATPRRILRIVHGLQRLWSHYSVSRGRSTSRPRRRRDQA